MTYSRAVRTTIGPKCPAAVFGGNGCGQPGELARQGVRALRPTRPAGRLHHLAEPSADGPTRDNGLDFAPWHAPRRADERKLAGIRGFRQGKVLDGRNPLLLVRVVGTLLLRLDERRFDA